VKVGAETLVGASGMRHAEVASFKGIPFARPPTGDLRWRAPRPPAPGSGTRAATQFAPACFQDSSANDWYRKVGKAFGADPSAFRDPPFSEDCLYLNVWTPAVGRMATLPVIVWIHGGGNFAGWSYEPDYDGENLAAQGGVVVVSIAYRLGVFGSFGHPALRGSAAPANFGLLDQIAALHWVHTHIRRFGGNPGNVTIAGESAGAADVGFLAASPRARHLFERVISESGGYPMLKNKRLDAAERIGTALSNALPGHPTLAAMRQLPSEVIYRAAKGALDGQDWDPVVDGISLRESPAADYRRRGIAYDLLVGSNRNEWYMYVDGDATRLAKDLETMPAGARTALGALAAEAADVRHGWDRFQTFAEMACPSYLMAASAARAGRKSWVYRFSRVRPGAGGEQLLAYHGAEIPYVFDTHDRWFSGDAADVALTRNMLAYWSAFAHGGDPNGAGRAAWPRFDETSPRVLELDASISTRPAPDIESCRRLAAVLYPGWQS
jgi:para-nitrobenzyl esterase